MILLSLPLFSLQHRGTADMGSHCQTQAACIATDEAALQALGYDATTATATTVTGLGTISCHSTHARTDAGTAPTATCSAAGEAFVFTGCSPQSSPAPTPGSFPGSNIVTGANRDAWEAQLLSWQGETAGEFEWALCYSSFLHPTDSASEFHDRCDVHGETLSIGTNMVGGVQRTFGGYAMVPWSCPECEQYDATRGCQWNGQSSPEATGNWIFRLGPETPAQYLPTSGTNFMNRSPSGWPQWGGGTDLSFGNGNCETSCVEGCELGYHGSCSQSTYASSSGDTCGSGLPNRHPVCVDGVASASTDEEQRAAGCYPTPPATTCACADWGVTQLEVWYRVTPPCPSCFAGSQLVSAEQATTLNGWIAGGDPAQAWTRCFSSFEEDSTSPSLFHQRCDPYDVTLTVARNSLGYKFGGYAIGSWNKDACCAKSANVCTAYTTGCYDTTAAADFIFRLEPGDSQRFLPNGADTNFQMASPASWPAFGNGWDIDLGMNGPPGTDGGRCIGADTEGTYAAATNEVCGGNYPDSWRGDWGQTDIEVWRLAWLQSWDSGAVTNANGRTFTLYLLPPQPPNTFANSGVGGSDAGARLYADVCAAAGLRTITTGESSYYPSQTSCNTYGCVPGGDSSDNTDGNVNVDSIAPWVGTATGWSEFVVLWGNPGTGSGFLRREHDGAIRSDTWDFPLHPVCGAEHCASECGVNKHCSADGVCVCDEGWYGAACDIDAASYVADSFTGTSLMSTEQAAWLLSQLPAGEAWVRCFDSATDDASTPAVFHQNCDPFAETVSVASNSLGYTFGGYAEHSWGGEPHYDDTSTANFIFGLEPEAPTRFDATGSDTRYATIRPTYWPYWGGAGGRSPHGRYRSTRKLGQYGSWHLLRERKPDQLDVWWQPRPGLRRCWQLGNDRNRSLAPHHCMPIATGTHGCDDCVQ